MEYLLDAQSLRMFVQQRVFPIPGRPTIKIFFVSVIKNVLWPSRCFVFPTRPGIDFQILPSVFSKVIFSHVRHNKKVCINLIQSQMFRWVSCARRTWKRRPESWRLISDVSNIFLCAGLG